MTRKANIIFSIFTLFCVLPIVSLFDISITFYLFLIFVLFKFKSGIRITTPDNYVQNVLIIFYITTIISLVFAPKNQFGTSIIKDIRFQIQYLFWIFIAIIVANNYSSLNIKNISKMIFIGNLLLIIYFYFFKGVFFTAEMPQNTFAILQTSTSAIGVYYLHLNNKKWLSYTYLIILIGSSFFSLSRTGFLIILSQSLIIFFWINRNSYLFKLTLGISLISSILFMFYFLSDNKPLNEILGEAVVDYNPRVSKLLINYSYLNEEDRSWMIRKAMIEKSLLIVRDYPFFGIGNDRFTNYDQNVEVYGKLKSAGALSRDRSSHNAYYQLLAENGIIGFTLVIIVFLSIIYYFFRYYKFIMKGDPFLFFVFISFMGMLVHFYTKSNLVGTTTWFIIGLATTIVKKGQYYAKKKNRILLP